MFKKCVKNMKKFWCREKAKDLLCMLSKKIPTLRFICWHQQQLPVLMSWLSETGLLYSLTIPSCSTSRVSPLKYKTALGMTKVHKMWMVKTPPYFHWHPGPTKKYWRSWRTLGKFLGHCAHQSPKPVPLLLQDCFHSEFFPFLHSILLPMQCSTADPLMSGDQSNGA